MSEIASYREMRVRPICEGAEGVTISGTEYVMDLAEMVRLRNFINEGICRQLREPGDLARAMREQSV